MQRAKDVKQTEHALAQTAEVRHITRDLRKVAATKPRCTCFDEGIYCPSKEHFTCDECFEQHVKSQCEVAECFVPYAADEVWCVYKPMQGDNGCTSVQPVTHKVRDSNLLLPPFNSST